jgi:hypothetical protein
MHGCAVPQPLAQQGKKAMKRFKRKFAWTKCESPLPRPEHKYCFWPDCGAELNAVHWACKSHWILYPKAFRLYANAFKDFWEGHPPYDHFAAMAKSLGERIAAGDVCTFIAPTPEDYAEHARETRAETTGETMPQPDSSPPPEAAE